MSGSGRARDHHVNATLFELLERRSRHVLGCLVDQLEDHDGISEREGMVVEPLHVGAGKRA
jgi:hypothetical protein